MRPANKGIICARVVNPPDRRMKYCISTLASAMQGYVLSLLIRISIVDVNCQNDQVSGSEGFAFVSSPLPYSPPRRRAAYACVPSSARCTPANSAICGRSATVGILAGALSISDGPTMRRTEALRLLETEYHHLARRPRQYCGCRNRKGTQPPWDRWAVHRYVRLHYITWYPSFTLARRRLYHRWEFLLPDGGVRYRFQWYSVS